MDFGQGGLFAAFFVLLSLAPLGVWKLVEILIYIFHNLHWG